MNKRFADRFRPGESALGKIVETAGEARQVIGVVETGKYVSLGEEPWERSAPPGSYAACCTTSRSSTRWPFVGIPLLLMAVSAVAVYFP